MVETVLLDVSLLKDPDVFTAYYENMPAYRKAKTDRIRPENEKRLSLGTGIVLNQALTDAGLGTDHEIAFGRCGKPYFPDLKDRFQFSLSHSGTYAFCVYSYDPEGRVVPVGCDIQEIRSTDIEKMLKHFHPHEREQLLSCTDPAERKEMFFRLWTLKESVIKADGRGMSLPLSDFCIDLKKDSAAALKPFDHYIFRENRKTGGYAVSWCYQKEHD